MSKEFLIQMKRYLSQLIAQKQPFLQLTACCNVEERELIGYCKAFQEINDDEEFNKYINEKIIPIITYIGRAKWGRTELTNLGLILGMDEAGFDLT